MALPTEVEQSPPRSAEGSPAVNATGMTSSTTTAWVFDGPVSVTVIVYPWARPSPATTVARPSVTVTFFFKDAATAEIYALPLHDALPIFVALATAVTVWAATPAPTA